MDMKLEDVAELLNVKAETVQNWVDTGQLPAYQIQNEYRFNREQVEQWMMEHLGETTSSGAHRYSLYRAIHKGDLFTDISGNTKEQVIRQTTERLATRFELDADVLSDLLLDRERLGPTAINHGVAIPHTRDFLMPHHFDVVTLVFPEGALDYGALDAKPVHSLFFLFACQDTHHLELLSKIAHFCHKTEHLELLASRPEKSELLSHVKQWEESLQPQA